MRETNEPKTPEAPTHIDHLALPSYDEDATHRFYADTLGFELRGEHEGRSAMWGDRRYRISSYATPGGSLLDLFWVEGLTRPESDGLPVGIRHFALGVGSRAAVEAWRERLQRAGAWASELDEHGGTHLSVYTFDPNGHQIEITWRPGRDGAR
jgi:catechol 2,3-dioxygenase-like lactoylglutathione lyase family enzyme